MNVLPFHVIIHHFKDTKIFSSSPPPVDGGFRWLERKVYRIAKAGSIKNLKLVTEVLKQPKADEVCESESNRAKFCRYFAFPLKLRLLPLIADKCPLFCQLCDLGDYKKEK
jgi:hypothetical protein